MNNLSYDRFKRIAELHDKVYQKDQQLRQLGVDINDDGIVYIILEELFYQAFPQLKDIKPAFELDGDTDDLTIFPIDSYDIFLWLWQGEGSYEKRLGYVYNELNGAIDLSQEDVLRKMDEMNREFGTNDKINRKSLNKNFPKK